MKTQISPPHSLLLVMDPRTGKIPKSMNDSLIAYTESCVAFGCRSEYDGDTEVVLGPQQDVDPGTTPQYSGMINTPNGFISICTILGDEVLTMSGLEKNTHITIWANDEFEPDRVIVGVDR